MRTLSRSLAVAAVAGLLVLFSAGCSRDAKKNQALEQANRHFDAGQYDQAEIEYKNVLQLDPLNAQAISRMGLIYYDEGRVGLAYSYLKKGNELQPDNLTLRIKLGTFDLIIGQFDDAKKEAIYVLERKPTDAEAPLLLANAFTQKKEVEEVHQRLLQLPAPAPEGAPVLLALGTLEFRQRNLKEAEAFFRRAEAVDPKSPAVFSALAGIHLAQNNPAQTEADLQKAAELSPPRSPLRLQYVVFKLKSGDNATGRRLLEEMIKATPDYLPALVTLAQLSIGEKKYDECDALLAKIFARDATLPEALMLSSQLGLARGQPDKAIAEAEKALKLYPRSPQVAQQLGLAYLAGGQPDKAAASLGQALAISPGMTDAAMTLASINLRKGDFTAAIIALKQIVQEHPELAQAWALLADAYRGQGNLSDALAVYVEMDKRFPASAQTPFFRGLIYVQQNKRTEARQEFNKALGLSPDFLPAVTQLVNLDLGDRQYAAAEQRVQALIAKDPKQGANYLLLAGVYGAQKDNQKAEDALKKAIELQPESPNAYYLLASLYYSTNEHQKALADLKTLIAKNPKDTQALMMMGALNDEIKDYAAARDAYEKLLAVNPRFVPALNNLAYLYSERFDQLDKGYDAAQKARQFSGQEPHIADTLGWILYKKHQYPRALGLLEESAGSLPAQPEILFHLGMAHYMTGDEDEARATLQRALAINDTFTGAAMAKQSLSVLSMDIAGTGARTALEKTVADHPEDPMALARLGEAYEQAGDAAKAISTYENVLKLSPNNIKAALSLARLYAARSETAKAFELAKVTRKLAPTDPDVAHVLGRLAYQTGDYNWSLSLLQEAARPKANDPEVLFDLARASYGNGRVSDAESAMRSALQANPQFPEAAAANRFLEMSALSANPAQAEAASARVQQVLKTDPSDVPALMAWGTISERKQDAAAAKQAYEKALTVFPDFSPAKRRLAVLYSADPANNQKALELGLKAREAFPDDVELARALGIVAYRQKDFKRAATWLQESATKQPNDATVQYYLGMTRYQLKQTAPSRQALQRALELGLAPDLATDTRRVLAELK